MIRPAVPSVYKYSDSFRNLNVVADDFSIQIPQSWMPLFDGEEIVATFGQVPKMTTMAWVYSICSLGYYYCFYVRRKKFTRTALVLTNKRLIAIDIYQRGGTIPNTLSNFSFQVRSYILNKVYSGYINSKNKNSLETGIDCAGGAIKISFSGNGRCALPFVHSLMMSVRRKEGVMSSSLSSSTELKDTDKVLGSIRASLIPFITDEKVIDIIRGSTDNVYEDCGRGIFARACNTLRCMVGCGCCCCTKKVENCWSIESCNDECCCSGQRFTPFFFPCLPYVLSCGLRPFLLRSTVIVTNSSILRIASVSNYGLCGFLRHCGIQGPFALTDSFIISWEEVDSLSGVNVEIMGAGRESFITRLCRDNCCGRVCCPIGVSTADLKLDFKGKYSYSTKKLEPNYSWVKDQALNKSVKILTRLQAVLQNEAKSSMSPKTAKASRLPSKAPPVPPIAQVIVERDLEEGERLSQAFETKRDSNEELWSTNKLS